MKRYLLSLLIVPLLLIGGYSSAYDYSLLDSLTFNTPSPSKQYFSSDFFCDYLPSGRVPTLSEICVKVSPVGTLSNVWLSIHNARYNITNYTSMTCFPISYSCYGTTTEVQVYGSNFDGTVITFYKKVPSLPIDNSSFTPIITGLTGSIDEFIPYVVYIGLGVLGVLISFVAIKRLINWVRAKIFSSFK